MPKASKTPKHRSRPTPYSKPAPSAAAAATKIAAAFKRFAERKKRKRTSATPYVPKKLKKQITTVVKAAAQHDVWFPVKSLELDQLDGTSGLLPIESHITGAHGAPNDRILFPDIIQLAEGAESSLFTRNGNKVYPKSLTLSGLLDLTNRFSFDEQFNWHDAASPFPNGALDRMAVTVRIFVFDWAKSNLKTSASTPEDKVQWHEIKNYNNGKTPGSAEFDEVDWDPAKYFDKSLGKMDPGKNIRWLARKTLKWKMGCNYNVGDPLEGLAGQRLARQSRRRFRISIPVPKVLTYPESGDQQPTNFTPMAFAIMSYDNGATSATVPAYWLKLMDLQVRLKFSP